MNLIDEEKKERKYSKNFEKLVNVIFEKHSSCVLSFSFFKPQTDKNEGKKSCK